MNAIKAIKIAMMLDLCPLFATGRAWTFSPRVNGVPLTVSTNRKSFTGGSYWNAGPRASTKKASPETDSWISS